MRQRSAREGLSTSGQLRMPRPGRATADFILAVVVVLALAGVGLYLSQSCPVLVRPLLVLLGIGCVVDGILLRRMLRHRSAAGPGPIEITALREAPGPPPEELTAALCNALTSVHLASPSTIPGESAPQDFITDVHTVAASASPWGLLLAAATAFLPGRAYRVSLVVRTSEAKNTCGLTIEVTNRYSSDVSVATVWGPTWSAVMEHAACHVAAHILPRTRLCRQPPWTPWHGVELDPELFHHFTEARRLARVGRFEEALDHFDRAAALDPRNPYIRFEKATILEQLGLHIDALAVYVDVVTMESWHHEALWKRYRQRFGDGLYKDARPRRFRPSPNGATAVRLARYGMIGALGASQRIAAQWRTPPRPGQEPHQPAQNRPTPGMQSQGRRREDAERIVSRLRPLLRAYAAIMIREHGILDPAGIPLSDIERSPELLRRVLQFAALVEAKDLVDDCRPPWWRRWRPLSRSRWPHHPPAVSGTTIRALLPWAALQYRYLETLHSRGLAAAHRADPKSTNADPESTNAETIFTASPWLARLAALPPLRERHPGLAPEIGRWPAGRWPPPPDLVTRLVIPRPPRRWGWLEHYNAACVFAVSMVTPEMFLLDPDLVDEPAAKDHQNLVRRAVNQLELAVVASESQFAAGRAPWFRYGDQDLEDLRVTPEYQTFIDRFLPDVAPLARLPRNVELLAITGHLFRLVERYARLRKESWEAHAKDQPVPAKELLREADWWIRLREFCRDYRDWPTRRDLIQLATESSGTFDSAMPKIEEDKQWANRTWRIHETVASNGTDVRPRIHHWLMLSAELGIMAQGLIDERNSALDGLWEKLDRHLPARIALEQALVSAGTDHGGGRIISPAQLAEGWRSVEWYMRQLRHGLPQPHPLAAGSPPQPPEEALARAWRRARDQAAAQVTVRDKALEAIDRNLRRLLAAD